MEVQIILPQGAFGAYAGEDKIATAIRIIAIGFGSAEDWCTKYGCDFENEVFLMKPFCWCERGDCDWCMDGDQSDFDERLRARFGTTDYQAHADRGYYDPPNFWYKPTNFRMSWYKYIGRGMASNQDSLPGDFMDRIFATHPHGMTIAQAVEKADAYEVQSANALSAMMGAIHRPPR